tara:strand:+ start:83 stop:190 length:108 start_codon:yes stop_codon:yes gene_type:complete
MPDGLDTPYRLAKLDVAAKVATKKRQGVTNGKQMQ